MKRIISIIIASFAFHYSMAVSPYPSQVGGNKPIQFVSSILVDACMAEYTALSQINEEGYQEAVRYCDAVYQDPYFMICRGQAIMMWSYYQDQIFDYLVICQNGNPAKGKSEKKQ